MYAYYESTRSTTLRLLLNLKRTTDSSHANRCLDLKYNISQHLPIVSEELRIVDKLTKTYVISASDLKHAESDETKLTNFYFIL